jgi:hypothetical protein
LGILSGPEGESAVAAAFSKGGPAINCGSPSRGGDDELRRASVRSGAAKIARAEMRSRRPRSGINICQVHLGVLGGTEHRLMSLPTRKIKVAQSPLTQLFAGSRASSIATNSDLSLPTPKPI